MRDVIINRTPIQDMGLGLVNATDWLRGPTVARGTVTLPGFMGSVPLEAGTVAPRDIVLASNTKDTTSDTRYQSLSRVVQYLERGLLEVEFLDRPDALIEAYLVNHQAVPISNAPPHIDPPLRHIITLRAFNPYKLDSYSQYLHLPNGQQVAVPLGDMRTGGYLFLYAENPTVTYRNAGGAALNILSLTWGTTPDPPGAYQAGDYWRIDLGMPEITKVRPGTGEWSSWASRDTSTPWDQQFFQPDPADGDPILGVWPTISVTGGGRYVYRRTYYS